MIKCRLDRFLASSNWTNSFPNFTNNHLLRYKSDHTPMLLEFDPFSNPMQNAHKQKPIRYEQVWTRDGDHCKVVKSAWDTSKGTAVQKLKATLVTLSRWGNNKFGIIPRRIKEVENKLKELNVQNGNQDLDEQIRITEKDLDHLLQSEEMWWSQRSRALWLQHGDKNTKFFHMKANIRRRKNRIETITNNTGQTYHDDLKIEQVFINHFHDLFSSQDTFNIEETVKVVRGRINQDMYNMLNESFTREEVLQAIKDMKALAAPGPDGLPALFYHNYWDVIGQEITDMALGILNYNHDPSPLNHTYICLIPKCDSPSTPSDFRPISLCNVTLKLITNTIANRIKEILPNIISQNQSAFVKGRLITDNTIIAADIFNYLQHTTRKNGYVGIKTDMAKAYDRVEWKFLESTLISMGFPIPLTQTIMKCVTTVQFSILLNGYPTRNFQPQRGLRQGDPLSPYLFILCADVLSGLISKAQQDHLIHGVRIAPRAPEITHLLFADDSLLFCRSNMQEVKAMNEVLQQYQKASGQLVSLNKSEITFSKRVNREARRDINQILPIQEKDHFNKYLGLPTVVRRSKNQVFNFIQEKIWKKLKSWKERNLSFAGRGTLIRAVAQAIPTYIMSSFLILRGICEQMEKMICNFWWGSSTDRHKIHWTKWSKITKHKLQGGLGFKNLRAFNEALLAKQG